MCEGCEERIHVGHQVHRIDRSISKLLEMRVKEEGLDEIYEWILGEGRSLVSLPE